jgi:hypothetical protein
MATFYKAILNGTYAGKDNKNILWYRSAIDPLDGLFGFGGARELAQLIVDHVKVPFLAVKPLGYELQDIDVYPHNDLLTALYQLPYKLPVKENGSLVLTGDSTDGPGICMNFRFDLEPTVIGLQTLTAPKRGYLAIGPVPSPWIDNDGKLVDSLLTGEDMRIRNLQDAISSDLASIAPPADFFPIRVSQKWGAGSSGGGLISWGWADVQGAAVDEYVSFRRSRRNKG